MHFFVSQVYVPGGSKSQRPLWGDDLIPASQSDFTAAANALPYKDSVRSDSSSSSGSYGTENGSKRERSQAVIPEWWVPPRFTVYTTPSRQEELQKQVCRFLIDSSCSAWAGCSVPASLCMPFDSRNPISAPASHHGTAAPGQLWEGWLRCTTAHGVVGFTSR